jgi:hypothetical protein
MAIYGVSVNDIAGNPEACHSECNTDTRCSSISVIFASFWESIWNHFCPFENSNRQSARNSSPEEHGASLPWIHCEIFVINMGVSMIA